MRRESHGKTNYYVYNLCIYIYIYIYIYIHVNSRNYIIIIIIIITCRGGRRGGIQARTALPVGGGGGANDENDKPSKTGEPNRGD